MKTCLLVLLLLGLCALSTQAPVCEKIYLNVNMWNAPFQTLKNIYSVEDCQQACKDNSQCEFFVYFDKNWTRDKQTLNCHLKNGKPKAVQYLQSIHSGYSRNCESLDKITSLTDPDCEVLYLNVNMWNAPFKTLKDIKSAEECRQFCEDNSECDFFVHFGKDWTRDDQTLNCYLKKDKPGNVESLPHITSGYASRYCKKIHAYV